MKRMGRRHRAFFRINAIESRNPRDGRVIEELGWYDPVGKKDEQVNLNRERIEYWLGVGAQPSETVRNLLKKNGIAVK
jgi:small subunit ribosomal protein S16